MYEVIWAERRGQKFATLGDALQFARRKATELSYGTVVAVWNESELVIGVVTDDANGVTVHRLQPANWVGREEFKAWTDYEATPPLPKWVKG